MKFRKEKLKPPTPPARLVRRISDGKVFEVIDELNDEICIEEYFDYSDGVSRFLKLWHSSRGYETFKENIN